MEGRVGYILAFLLGGLVGSVIAYKFAYDKAEERADLEIEEMRNYFLKKPDPTNGERIEVAVEKSRQSQNKPSIVELANVNQKVDTQKVNYTAYSEGPKEEASTTSEPVLLDESEYGDITYYSRVNLTFYDDLILADDSTMKTFKKDEIDRAIGRKALDRFNDLDSNGEPINQIWVRNDRTKTYYSIVKDDREYAVAAGWEDDGEY